MTLKNTTQSVVDRAQQEYQAGDFLAAATSFSQAADSYSQAKDSLQSAEMRNNQSVALLRAKRPAEALEAARGTEAVFSAAGEARREGMAYANQASALEALHRSSEAIEYYRKAGEALEKAGEKQLRVHVMQLLSALYLRKFKFFDAIATLQSGLAGVEDLTPMQRLMKKFLFIHF
jgi:tetratricopeptide (TPR) repeat protein